MWNLKSKAVARSVAIVLSLAFLGGAVTASSAKPIKGTWGKTKLTASCKAGGGVAWNVASKGKGAYGCTSESNGSEVTCKNGKCEITVKPQPKPKTNPK